MLSRNPTTIRSSFPLSVVFFSLLAFCFAISGQSVSAQSAGAGVSISPAIIEETLDAGVEKEFSVRVENLNSVEQTFYLSSRDIAGVGPNGAPIFAEDWTEKTGYELSDWIELHSTEMTLRPAERQSFTFTLQVPENAPPGSHFGGVFISADPPEIEQSGAAVGYKVANIISIRVSGDADERASIRQFATDKFLNGSQNIDFTARVENAGNVLVRPSGPLEIYNMLGKKVDTIIFNEQQSAVFPKVVREYKIKWEGEGVGFGRYEAVLSAVYGDTGAKRTMSSTATFWILPMNIIGPAAAALFVLLLITYVSVRVYIKRTLAQFSYGGAKVVRNRRRKRGTPTVLLLTVVMLMVTAVFLVILLALFA